MLHVLAFKVKGENEELPKPVAYPLSNTRQELYGEMNIPNC